ncbi:unnamed protein product [Discosporangium mesarthrocarpum]
MLKDLFANISVKWRLRRRPVLLRGCRRVRRQRGFSGQQGGVRWCRVQRGNCDLQEGSYIQTQLC